MNIDEAKYKKDFGIDPENTEKLKAALGHALDIRKFEIELYWKRASYFWTLIAAAFAGYFVILSAQNLNDKRFMAFVVACVGFLFTFAWFQVNRGSKQWQENWENHVDILEDKVTGPLYKTILGRPSGDDFFERHVTGPGNISVSKTNQIVSLFTLCIWLALAYFTVDVLGCSSPLSIKHVAVGSLTVGFCILILWRGRTHLGDHTHIANQRTTKVLTLRSRGCSAYRPRAPKIYVRPQEFIMRHQISIFVVIIFISIAASLLFLTAMEGLLVWTNLTLGFCAISALLYQSRANQHQNEMRNWDANRGALISLATTLSDAIESTNQSIREYYEDESKKGNSEIFKRLHEAMRHTIDIHAVLLDEEINSAIARYKDADDEISERWNNDSIQTIEAIEESERLMRTLLEDVRASIKSHASL